MIYFKYHNIKHVLNILLAPFLNLYNLDLIYSKNTLLVGSHAGAQIAINSKSSFPFANKGFHLFKSSINFDLKFFCMLSFLHNPLPKIVYCFNNVIPAFTMYNPIVLKAVIVFSFIQNDWNSCLDNF